MRRFTISLAAALILTTFVNSAVLAGTASGDIPPVDERMPSEPYLPVIFK